jgi:hypothetical protein
VETLSVKRGVQTNWWDERQLGYSNDIGDVYGNFELFGRSRSHLNLETLFKEPLDTQTIADLLSPIVLQRIWWRW